VEFWADRLAFFIDDRTQKKGGSASQADFALIRPGLEGAKQSGGGRSGDVDAGRRDRGFKEKPFAITACAEAMALFIPLAG